MKSTKIIPILAVALFLFGAIGVVNAATLTFDVPDTVTFGETFTVPIRIDPGEECINTVAATITYPTDVLTAVDVSRGESILSLWVEPPKIASGDGIITFSGGIPGGYCGMVSGDVGDANVILTLVFAALENPGEIGEVRAATLEYVSEPSIFINDGFGTPAPVSAPPATFTVRELGEFPEDTWADAFDADDIWPERFKIEEYRNPSDGINYITFSTTDKQTGIDYYEVLEVDFDGNTPNTNKQASWQKWEAVEGYRLIAQDGSSRITVRAYDKAGNWRDSVLERRAEVTGSALGVSPYIIYGGAFIIVIALFLLAVFYVRRKRIKNSQSALQ